MLGPFPSAPRALSAALHALLCCAVQVSQGDLEEGIASYDAALAKDPDNKDLVLNLGMALKEMSVVERAEKVGGLVARPNSLRLRLLSLLHAMRNATHNCSPWTSAAVLPPFLYMPLMRAVRGADVLQLFPAAWQVVCRQVWGTGW